MPATRERFVDSVLKSTRADLVGVAEKVLIARLLLVRLGEPDRLKWWKKPVFSPDAEALFLPRYPRTHKGVRVAMALNLARRREREIIKPQKTVTFFAMGTHAEEIVARAERALVESPQALDALFEELRDASLGGARLLDHFVSLGVLPRSTLARLEGIQKPEGEGSYSLGPIRPAVLERPEGLGDAFRVLLAGFCASGEGKLVIPYYEVPPGATDHV